MQTEQFATHGLVAVDSIELVDHGIGSGILNQAEGTDEQDEEEEEEMDEEKKAILAAQYEKKWKNRRTGHRCKEQPDCRRYAIRGNSGYCEVHRPPLEETEEVEDQVPGNGKHVIDDDFCFICLEGGVLVCCEDPFCPRVYHASCLAHPPARYLFPVLDFFFPYSFIKDK